MIVNVYPKVANVYAKVIIRILKLEYIYLSFFPRNKIILLKHRIE